MPRYILSAYGQRFGTTADSPSEAKKKVSRRLHEMTGLKIPPSHFNVLKTPK